VYILTGKTVRFRVYAIEMKSLRVKNNLPFTDRQASCFMLHSSSEAVLKVFYHAGDTDKRRFLSVVITKITVPALYFICVNPLNLCTFDTPSFTFSFG
jgi:hypothetical protein